MEKRQIFLVFVLSLVLFNSIFVSAVTGSIGNAKVVLYPEVNGLFNTVIDRTINVKNVNEIPVLINLTVDSEGKEFIDLQDESFILQPGEERKAEFKVKVKKEGNYEGRVNVFFSPSDPESKEAGVVLSSTVVVIAKKDQGYEEESSKDNQNPTTGNAIGEEKTNKKNSNFLIYFSPVLLLALLVLLFIMGKKGKKPKLKKTKNNDKK